MMKRLLSFLLSAALFTCAGIPLTLGACADGSAAPATVVLSPQKLSVDGKLIDCEKYNIGGSNYFKLRDIARLLGKTGSRFSVGYDEASGLITLESRKGYTVVGGELIPGEDRSSSAQPSKQTLRINGKENAGLSVYNIGGNNFFKLRDLGSLLGFAVDYDAENDTALVVSAPPSIADICPEADATAITLTVEDGTLFETKNVKTLRPLLNKALAQKEIDYTSASFKSLSATAGDPINLTWKYNRQKPKKVEVVLANDPDFSNAVVFEAANTTLRAANLKTGVRYYWYVRYTDGGTQYSSPVGYFDTEPGFRVITVSGVTNLRDIGGWETADGRRMKTGLAYRGANADDVSSKGVETMTQELGIVTEIDLRRSEEGKCGKLVEKGQGTLGEKVRYYNFPEAGYYTYLSGDFAASLRLFADPANYPIYFHCAGGNDRTATLALFLQALCGCDETTLVTDFELSAARDRTFEEFPPLMKLIKNRKGETLREKTNDYLRKVLHLTDMELSNIYHILMDDAAIFTADSLSAPVEKAKESFTIGIDLRESGGVKSVTVKDAEVPFAFADGKLAVSAPYAKGSVTFLDGSTLDFGKN